MDDKTLSVPAEKQTPPPSDPDWVDDMKQEMEDYVEEQGIYIRQ